jgi:hypothetical protein
MPALLNLLMEINILFYEVQGKLGCELLGRFSLIQPNILDNPNV